MEFKSREWVIDVFIVLEEPIVRSFVYDVLTAEGFHVNDFSGHIESDGADCYLKQYSDRTPDLAVIDVILRGAYSGIDVSQKALRRWPRVRILLTSGSTSDTWPLSVATRFTELPRSAFAFLPMPFSASQLRAAAVELLGRPA
jgi:DNA-binding NtrC family response regulator